jgi:hypothetical protein
MADWRDQWERSNLLNEGDWSVDWIQAALVAIGALLTAFFDAVAQLISQSIQTFVIQPLTTFTNELEKLVGWPFVLLERSLDFETGIALATDTGFIGAIVIVGAGTYVLAYLYSEVIADG